MGAVFGVLFATFACFNLAFIIPSLIYAYQNSACVLTRISGFDLDLKTWLQVDAYTRLGMIGLLLVVAIVFCVSFKAGVGLAICVIILMILYSLFALAWLIVGSVLFWGKLKPTGVCTGGVHDYMYALLIISFIGVCLNCCLNLGQGKKQTS